MRYRNRVDPLGTLHVNPSKSATLMVNRRCLHNNSREVVREKASTKRWIACTMESKFGKRSLMKPGSYTELFFLDEVTALAAGHRPCAQCRPEAYKEFARAWLAAGLSPTVCAEAMDRKLDTERGIPRPMVDDLNELSDGVMIRLPDGDDFFLVHGDSVYPWSFGGYGTPVRVPRLGTRLELITPRSIVKVLQHGYVPEIHSSGPCGTGVG